MSCCSKLVAGFQRPEISVHHQSDVYVCYMVSPSLPNDRARLLPQRGKTGDNTVMLRLIGFYQRWVSPLLPPRCRFFPTCSSYAAEAIEHHGLARGASMAFRRVCKCHPFHSGGYDPVPINDKPDNQANPSLSSTDNHPANRQNTINQ